MCIMFSRIKIVKVVLADWKVKTPCHANVVFINKMLSLNRFFLNLLVKDTIY